MFVNIYQEYVLSAVSHNISFQMVYHCSDDEVQYCVLRDSVALWKWFATHSIKSEVGIYDISYGLSQTSMEVTG